MRVLSAGGLGHENGQGTSGWHVRDFRYLNGNGSRGEVPDGGIRCGGWPGNLFQHAFSGSALPRTSRAL